MTHSHIHLDINQGKGMHRLIWALLVNVLLTIVQIIGGIVSGSLALIADAVHNFSDAASLLVALIARQWSTKPADRQRTFGYRRAELVGAMINLVTLIMIGIYLLFEALLRFFQPEPINGWIVVIIASIALLVDVITAALTYSLSKNSINIRAAFLHNLADAFSSVAVIFAGTLILLYEWYFVDAFCTLLISGYVLYHGYREIRVVIRILMQSVPIDLKISELTQRLEDIDKVKQVHHIHIWEIDEHTRSLEAHFVIEEQDFQCANIIKQQIKECLINEFNITHSTIEFEFENYKNSDCSDKSVISSH